MYNYEEVLNETYHKTKKMTGTLYPCGKDHECLNKSKEFIYYSVTPIESTSQFWLMRHSCLAQHYFPSSILNVQAPDMKAIGTIVKLAGGCR